jgi:hypothetical protein
MMTPPEMAKYLSGFSFRFNNEKELQYGIDQALQKTEEPFLPEFILSPSDRVDFYMTETGIGIEVKTNDSKGGASLSAVTRQLWRYAKIEGIKAIILVTSRSKHRDLPAEILGKPVFVVYLSSFL